MPTLKEKEYHLIQYKIFKIHDCNYVYPCSLIGRRLLDTITFTIEKRRFNSDQEALVFDADLLIFSQNSINHQIIMQ